MSRRQGKEVAAATAEERRRPGGKSKDYVVHWPDIMTATWDQFPMVVRLWTAELQRPPSGVPPMCDHYYMEWFNRYSHPRLIANLDHSDADYIPPPTAVEAWMGKIQQDVQKLSLEKDNMSGPARAPVDSLEQTLAHWESASTRDY